MKFKKDNSLEGVGERFGFLAAYLIFTLVLYSILIFFDKTPVSWNYLHIAIIVLSIAFLGWIVGRLIK